MKLCAAYNCRSKNKPLEPGSRSVTAEDSRNISFFRFPLRDKQRTDAWVSALKFEKFVPSLSSRLCSKHFTEDAMYIGKDNRRYLTKDSIPSIFEFSPHISPTKRRCDDFVRSRSCSESKKNMKQCAATNCSTVKICHDKNNLVKFFSFPRDKALANIWLSNCGRLDLKLKNRLPNKLYDSSYKLCSLHFSTEQFVYDTRRSKLKKDAVPTIFGDVGLADESLKRLKSLIKKLEDTNASLEVGFGCHSHIKKEVEEMATSSFEDITAEDRGTFLDCKSRKNNKNPNISTSEDMMDVNETLISKESEVLNNYFEEKYSSFDIDKESKLEIVDDEGKFKSIQEEIYSFPGITSGDGYEFETFNPILKREIEDDVKLEIDLIDESEKFNDEILTWDEVNTGDGHNKLSDNLDVKEVKCGKVLSEAHKKIEEFSVGEETISTPISRRCNDTYKDIPFLTHQISKQNNSSTSDIDLGRSFYSSRSICREKSQISMIGSNKPNANSEVSYNKNVYPITQAAKDMEMSFKVPKIDSVSLHHSFANDIENDIENNLVNKVIKKNIDKVNASITSSSSSRAMGPYKNCLEIPVDKKIVFIKLKPFKKKNKNVTVT